MSSLDYVAIVTIGILAAAGQYFMKIGVGQAAGETDALSLVVRTISNPNLLAAGVIYVLAFAVYLYALSRLNVSQIFPIAIGANIVCVVAMAVLFLGEPVTIWRGIGILAIVLGASVVVST